MNINKDVQKQLLQQFHLTVAEIRDIAKQFDLSDEKIVKNLQKQLEQEIPVAYILGNQPFRNHFFIVNPHVLIPREDSNCLIEKILELSHILIENQIQNSFNPSINLLEFGTGSGCLMISVIDELIKSHKLKLLNANINITATATDISLQALNIAQINHQNILPHFPINWIHGNWGKDWHNLTKKETQNPSFCFDIIFSNPPYIAIDDEHLKHQSLSHEPMQALTDYSADGLTAIRHILADVQRFQYLKPSGFIAFEHGWKQGELVRNLFKEFGYPINQTQTIQDDMGNDRVTFSQFLN